MCIALIAAKHGLSTRRVNPARSHTPSSDRSTNVRKKSGQCFQAAYEGFSFGRIRFRVIVNLRVACCFHQSQWMGRLLATEYDELNLT